MLFQTLTNTLRQRRLLVLLFVLTLLAAIPSALAFFSTLTSEFDGSLAPLQMLPGFNYTVFADFMHEHSGAVWPLIRVGWWSAVLSLLISLWTKGGILYSFINGFRTFTFWQSGTYYFMRYLRLLGVTSLFVLLWLVVLLLVGTLTGVLLDEALGDPFTERGYVIMVGLAGLVFALGLAYILCISQYASVLMYQIDETAALQAYRQSWRFINQHRRATFGRFLLLVLIGTALLGVYLLIESLFQAHNWFLIGLLALLQQAFVFSRVILTVWGLRIAQVNLGSLSHPIFQPVAISPPVSAPLQPATDPAGTNAGPLSL